jgi:formylmethanofuran--tetrahydromethanopterin N-formyltransferase
VSQSQNTTLSLNGVHLDDTFAEAFPIRAARVVITADSHRWANTAAQLLCGNATSVIACDAEAAIEQQLLPSQTPDARPGVSVLLFAFSNQLLATAIQNRVGQCVLTCPTTACFNGLPLDNCPKDKRFRVGGALRYFGDGWQSSRKIDQKRFWRIPVMDGEFLCEDEFASASAVAGGNLLICGTTPHSTLAAAELAATAAQTQPGVALPFPGGVVRSGSKVGSRYPKLKASTNEAWCPTLRGLVNSNLPADCNAVYEIVVDGLSFNHVQNALRHALHAATQAPNIKLISAGNYGGKLGKHHFHLRDLL